MHSPPIPFWNCPCCLQYIHLKGLTCFSQHSLYSCLNLPGEKQPASSGQYNQILHFRSSWFASWAWSRQAWQQSAALSMMCQTPPNCHTIVICVCLCKTCFRHCFSWDVIIICIHHSRQHTNNNTLPGHIPSLPQNPSPWIASQTSNSES